VGPKASEFEGENSPPRGKWPYSLVVALGRNRTRDLAQPLTAGYRVERLGSRCGLQAVVSNSESRLRHGGCFFAAGPRFCSWLLDPWSVCREKGEHSWIFRDAMTKDQWRVERRCPSLAPSCLATLAPSCEDRPECERDGLCTWLDGSCIAACRSDCEQAAACRLAGRCAACVARSRTPIASGRQPVIGRDAALLVAATASLTPTLSASNRRLATSTARARRYRDLSARYCSTAIAHNQRPAARRVDARPRAEF